MTTDTTPSAATWRSLYPFQSHFLTVDGHQLHYIDEGQSTLGTLLFVHGNPTWSFAWRNLITRFASRGYRCVAIDHLGCGLSDKPQNYPYTLERRIQHLTTLIRTLDLQHITLIVHDWGGAIGIGALGRNPDRFRAAVITNTAAFPSRHIPLRIAACRIPLLGPLGVRGLNLFAGMATTMATEQPGGLPTLVRQGYLAPYDNWHNRVAVSAFVNDIPMSPRHPSYATLEEVERSLGHLQSLPVQLIWGMRDWCFSPLFYREFERRLPHARRLELPNAGHYLFEDAPDQMLSCIQTFLNETTISTP